MDVNLPRDKNTGKTKGFGFLMYEDQRSTVLAVDNLNGARVLERTLRVDHVKNYKQPRVKGEDGEWQEPEEQSLNARPEIIVGTSVRLSCAKLSLTTPSDGGAPSESSDDSAPDIDPEDPMRDYLIAKRKEEKVLKKKSKSKPKRHREDETPEERRARKERKKARKRMEKSEGVQGVEELLKSLESGKFDRERRRDRSFSPNGRPGSRSRTPPRRQDRKDYGESGRSTSRERNPETRDRSYRSRPSRSRSPRPMGKIEDERRDNARRHDSMDERSRHSDHWNTKSRFDRD